MLGFRVSNLRVGVWRSRFRVEGLAKESTSGLCGAGLGFRTLLSWKCLSYLEHGARRA